MKSKKLKCLIIAAGEGTRIQARFDLKPLTPVSGVPIIQRVITNAMLAGIEEFFVVTGFQGDRLDAFLYQLGISLKVKITTIRNDRWPLGNATSVYSAEDYISGEFVLLMSDHLVDPELIRQITDNPAPDSVVCLAVDYDLRSSFVDVEDATKVMVTDGFIVSIGKELNQYNAYDTGVFYCKSSIFEFVSEIIEMKQYSLSQCIQSMAYRQQATTISSNGSTWIDIDNPEMLLIAEAFLDE